MRRTRLLYVILAFLGAVALTAAAWFLTRPTARPAAARLLSPKETAVLVGAFGLVEAVSALDQALAAASPEAKASLPAWLVAERRAPVLGFASPSQEGFLGLGLDAESGVGLALDARLTVDGRPVPVVLLKVDDAPRFYAFLAKLLGVAPTPSEAGDQIQLTFPNRPGLRLGERAGLTALVSDKISAEAFQAFLDGEPGLVTDPTFQQTVGASTDAAVFGYVGAEGLGALAAALGADAATTTVDHFAPLFPSLGLKVGARTELTLTATEEGLTRLSQLFEPKKPPAVFSRLVPAGEGWASARLSLDLVRGYDTVLASLPPAVPPKIRKNIGLFRVMAPLWSGVGMGDLAKAFTGHLVVSVRPQSVRAFAHGEGPLQAVALLGVADGEKAQAIAAKLLGLYAEKSGGLLEPLADLKGQKVSGAPLALCATLAGDVLVVATEPALLQAAVAPTAPLSPSAAAALDGPVVAAVVADGAALLGLATGPRSLAFLKQAQARLAKGQLVLKLEKGASGLTVAVLEGQAALLAALAELAALE